MVWENPGIGSAWRYFAYVDFLDCINIDKKNTISNKNDNNIAAVTTIIKLLTILLLQFHNWQTSHNLCVNFELVTTYRVVLPQCSLIHRIREVYVMPFVFRFDGSISLPSTVACDMQAKSGFNKTKLSARVKFEWTRIVFGQNLGLPFCSTCLFRSICDVLKY